MKMYTYLRHLFVYFEHVFHPAGPKVSPGDPEKRKRKMSRDNSLNLSPDRFNLRAGSKKQDKLRRNPAP
jgi:hypothetical protein